MDDLREQMERLARRVDGAAAPDLVEARDRVTRRRTRSALIVGLAVLVLGSYAAFSTLRPDGGQGPATQSETPPTVADEPGRIALWPENTARGDSVAATQEELNEQLASGGGNLEWRMRPQEVARRFAETALAWDDPIVVEDAHQGSPSETAWFFGVAPCGPGADCDLADDHMVVVVDQPGQLGETGIWSVTAVTSPGLAIDVPPATPEAALVGGSVGFDIEVPDYRSAHVGLVAMNGCNDASTFEIALDSGHFDLPVPEPVTDDPSCTDIAGGYVFAYAMDDTTEPIGDPLLEAAAIEQPWLTIVPAYVVMESSAEGAVPTPTPTVPAADSITITCDGEGTSIDHTVVAASASGVAISTSPYNEQVRLLFDGSRDVELIVDYAPAPIDLAPGEHTVGCSYGGVVPDEVSFHVVDPEGHWLDPSVDCAPPGETVDFDADAIAYEGDPRDELTSFAEQVLTDAFGEGGTLAFDGYPEAELGDEAAVVRLDDQSRVVGRVNFSLTDDGAWFPDGYVTCEGQVIF